METVAVTVHLPADLYAELQARAAEEQTDPAELIARVVATAHHYRATLPERDPVLALIGANNLKGSALVPDRTIEDVRADVTIAKEHVR